MAPLREDFEVRCFPPFDGKDRRMGHPAHCPGESGWGKAGSCGLTVVSWWYDCAHLNMECGRPYSPGIREGTRMAKILAFLLIFVGTAIGQMSNVTISDSNGNHAIGTIYNGNVFFIDSNGNAAHGTIRDGNVFLSTSNGELTFGTVRDGNVFLTDQKGNTTGTIRNGNIFLSNSDGSITTGTYRSSVLGTSVTTTATTNTSAPLVPTPQQQQEAQQQQEEQQRALEAQRAANYQAGYAVGQQIGNALAGAIIRHRARSFCKKHPYGSWGFPNGTVLACSTVNAASR
jgi:hypothetical protein